MRSDAATAARAAIGLAFLLGGPALAQDASLDRANLEAAAGRLVFENVLLADPQAFARRTPVRTRDQARTTALAAPASTGDASADRRTVETEQGGEPYAVLDDVDIGGPAVRLRPRELRPGGADERCERPAVALLSGRVDLREVRMSSRERPRLEAERQGLRRRERGVGDMAEGGSAVVVRGPGRIGSDPGDVLLLQPARRLTSHGRCAVIPSRQRTRSPGSSPLSLVARTPRTRRGWRRVRRRVGPRHGPRRHGGVVGTMPCPASSP